MGGLIESVGGIVQDELDRIAKEIEAKMKAKCPKRTGRAVASIHIENIGTGSVFGAGRFIGANANFGDYSDGGAHLYYADQGNGGSGAIIKSKRKTDRLGRKPGKLQIMNGMYTMYAPYVRGYEGTHFIRKIADQYR